MQQKYSATICTVLAVHFKFFRLSAIVSNAVSSGDFSVFWHAKYFICKGIAAKLPAKPDIPIVKSDLAVVSKNNATTMKMAKGITPGA